MVASRRVAPQPNRQFSAQGQTLCIAAFFLIDLLLMRRAWILSDNTVLFIAGLPLAQISLVSIWAAVSPRNFALRVFVVAIAGFLSLLLLSRILPWEIGHQTAALWAWAIVVQTTLTATLVTLARRYYQQIRSSNKTLGSIFQFDLNTLMLCTIVSAALFATIGYAARNLGWRFHIDDRFAFGMTTLLGCASATSATICWWILASESRVSMARRTLVGILLLAVAVATFIFGVSQLSAHAVAWKGLCLIAIVPFIVVLTAGAICKGRWLGRPASPIVAETTPESTETPADQIVLD